MPKRWDESFKEAYLQSSKQGGETAKVLALLKAKQEAERGKGVNILSAAGNALQGFSAPFLNLPWKPLEPTKGTAPIMPSDLWKEVDAASHFQAWQKQQSGQELNEYDRKLLGLDKVEDKTPSDYNLWKQAESEVRTAMGGSMMTGISGADKYYPAIEERYLALKYQFRTLTKEDNQTAAKKYLKRKGYAITPDNVNKLLQQNANNLGFLYEREEPAEVTPKKGWLW